jgi:hypothetical protein
MKDLDGWNPSKMRSMLLSEERGEGPVLGFHGIEDQQLK